MCLVISVIVIMLRVMYPIFQYELVKRVTLACEVTRLWACALSIMHYLFKVDSSAINIIIEIIIGATLVVVVNKGVD